jgi:phosphoribosyl-AMP cyclohydrolase
MDAQLNSLKYDSAGLVPIVVQDCKSGEVLMLAWANRQALEQTVATGKVHTYSRSRGRLALKGESSGHFQLVREILTDCDKDAVVIRAEQVVAACHEGYRSCFYRKYEPGASDWKTIAQKAFDPEKVYAAKS